MASFSAAFWQFTQNAWYDHVTVARQHRVALLALIGLLSLSLSGCTSLAVGGAATAGVAAFQERGLQGAASDTAITAEIWQKFLAQDENLFLNIEIEVVEGEVLLAGEVKTSDDELEAVKLTWQVNGVRRVLNEINVGEGTSLMDSASDLLITARLKTALMFDTDIYAINYSIETVKGTVHLMGIAQDDLERKRVIAHARETSYVRRVVSHIRLKNDATRQGT